MKNIINKSALIGLALTLTTISANAATCGHASHHSDLSFCGWAFGSICGFCSYLMACCSGGSSTSTTTTSVTGS